MKAPATLIWFFCVSLPFLQSNAAPVTGDSLSIGDNNDVTSHSTYGASIGSYNAVNTNGDSFLLVGSGNQMYYAAGSIVSGWSNEGGADTSIAIGWANNVWSMYSLVGGEMNTAGVYDGIVFGSNNSLSGGLQFAFGQGLINNDDPWNMTFYAGQYNKDITTSNPLFVIGNGTGPATNQRSNALEVYIDGKTKVNNTLEVKASNYNPSNVNSGRIVLQPSTSGSSVTVDGKSLLMANSSGYVGIGLSNPSHLLDLGGAYFESDGSASFAYGSAYIGDLYAYFTGNVQFASVSDPWGGGYNYICGTGTASNNTDFLNLGTGHGGLKIQDGDYGDEYLTVLGSGSSRPGFVGIGTNSPSASLDVNGKTIARNNVKIFGSSESWAEGLTIIQPSNWGGIRLARNDPASGNYQGNWALGYRGGSGNDFCVSTFYNGNQYDAALYISNSSRNVGLGTLSPQGNLQIQGSTVWDSSTTVNIANGSNDYGRTIFRLTGRLQDGNEAWSSPGSGRNSIVFARNVTGSGQNIGSLGADRFAIQYHMGEDRVGFVGADGSPKLSVGQDGVIKIPKRQGDILMGEFGTPNSGD